MISGRRICVTGGAGFIGSHLVERLVPKNRLVVFDNFHRDALSTSGLAQNPQVEIVKGDVLDADAVRRAIEGCDAVVHLASIAGVDTVIKHPVLTMKVSLLGTTPSRGRSPPAP
jgi:UDP-glucose 4-epimerase